MSCYARVGNFTEIEIGAFPCNREAADAVAVFIADKKTRYVSVGHKGAGIRWAIDEVVITNGATEWFCSFSNKVKPETELSIYYR